MEDYLGDKTSGFNKNKGEEKACRYSVEYLKDRGEKAFTISVEQVYDMSHTEGYRTDYYCDLFTFGPYGLEKKASEDYFLKKAY